MVVVLAFFLVACKPLLTIPPNNSLLLDDRHRAYLLRYEDGGLRTENGVVHPILGPAVLHSLGLHLEDVFVGDDNGNGSSMFRYVIYGM
jgi:hypothetical protein